MYGARLKGTQKLACELTLRDGKVVYDLNGITRPDWDTLPKDYGRPATRAGMRSRPPRRVAGAAGRSGTIRTTFAYFTRRP